MKPFVVRFPVKTLALVGAVALSARAIGGGVTPTPTPTPTLVRFELSPLEQPTALTAAIDACATLVKAGRLVEADLACDRAIRAALVDRADSAGSIVAFSPSRGLAAAYNNRAVLRYLQGELAEAAADSARALTAAPTPAFANTAAFIDGKLHRTARAEQ